MFNKILIANRGEIACRIIRTAKKLGIKTVAIYSAADVESLHVKLAEEAYFVGPAPSCDSYLKAETIVDIALKCHAEAIHPGYGFLAENAEFAELCEQAGIVFIGPPPEAIFAMGSKSAAKSLLQKLGLPLIPGYHGDKQDLTTFLIEAKKIGYPILLKAAAGGGGKGMRIVADEHELSNALTSAQREAQASFGDNKILLEKYLSKPRHIEIQIFADQHGNFVYLFERDCSIQRRHQKVIEEAPAPHLTPELREKMGTCAIEVARAINYVGAGTIEFLLDDQQQFYFMEMNTRLQVEHAITEMITGLDLVEWQLRVAANQSLPLTQNAIRLQGHAIETRIYAEDPNNQFLPSTGQITFLKTPIESRNLRLDSAVIQGDTISPYYDPMIAKLIVWDENRSSAIARLKNALTEFELIGVKNNINFLLQIISHPQFADGNINTNFINQYSDDLLLNEKPLPDRILAIATLYSLLKQQQIYQKIAINTSDPFSPWLVTDHWRMNVNLGQTFKFSFNQQEIIVTAKYFKEIYTIILPNKTIQLTGKLHNNELIANFINEQQSKFTVIEKDSTLYLFGVEGHYKLAINNSLANYELQEEASGSLNAPMPGVVVALMTESGKMVKRGDRLITMEAMKMEHTIHAPTDGIIKEIYYKIGDMVDEGAELLTIEEVT
jgi:3-methylcrotonyl-CoA carboxylase alpha subunit